MNINSKVENINENIAYVNEKVSYINEKVCSINGIIHHINVNFSCFTKRMFLKRMLRPKVVILLLGIGAGFPFLDIVLGVVFFLG